MFLSRTVGRAIPAETAEKKPPVVAYVLTALDLLVIGMLIGFIIVARLSVLQADVYGEERMVQVSVILDFMDDLLPYHAFTITAVVVLTALTLAAWLLSGVGSRLLRILAGLLLIICLVFGAIFLGLGSRSSVSSVPQMLTPTPQVTVPDL